MHTCGRLIIALLIVARLGTEKHRLAVPTRESEAFLSEIAESKGGNRQISAGAPLGLAETCRTMKALTMTVASKVLRIPESCNYGFARHEERRLIYGLEDTRVHRALIQ